MSENKFVKVIYEWVGEQDGDLNLAVGDIIKLKLTDDGWALGINQNNQEGQFPLNYTEPYKSRGSTPPTIPERRGSSLATLERLGGNLERLNQYEDDSSGDEGEEPEYPDSDLSQEKIHTYDKAAVPPITFETKEGKGRDLSVSNEEDIDMPPPLPPPADIAGLSLENIPKPANFDESKASLMSENDPIPPPLVSPPRFAPPPNLPPAAPPPALERTDSSPRQPPPPLPPPAGTSPRSDVLPSLPAASLPISNLSNLNAVRHHRSHQPLPLRVDSPSQDTPEQKHLQTDLNECNSPASASGAHIKGYENSRDKDEKFKANWQIVIRMRMSIKLKDRRSGLKMIKNCFLGTEAVDFLIGHRYCKTRKEAQDLASEFVNLGMIMHATGTDGFKDSKSCYIFLDKPLYGPMRNPPPDLDGRKEAMVKGGLIYSTTLLKLGGAFKNKLQQRYMELERIGKFFIIKYYHNVHKQPKGMIYLTGDCLIQEESNKPKMFSLVTMDRTYHFQTLLRAQRETWVKLLKECIKTRMKEWTEDRVNKLPKDEKFRKDVSDFINVIQLGEHKHKKTGQHLLRCFRGKEAVVTIQNFGMAETAHQAIVFGNQLIEHHVVKSYCNEHPFENKKHLYLLLFPETSSEKEGIMEEKSSRRTKSFILPEDFAITRMSKLNLLDKEEHLNLPNGAAGSPSSSAMTTPATSDAEGEGSPKVYSYSSMLPHCLEVLIEETRRGLKSSSAIYQQLLQNYKLELKFIEQNLKLSKSLYLGPGHTSMVGMRSLLKMAFEASSNQWSRHESRLKNMEEMILRPWKEQLSKSFEDLKVIEKKYKKIKVERDEMVTKLENTFKCCNQLTHKLKKNLAKAVVAEGEGGEKKSKNWKKLFNKGTAKKMEDLLRQLEKTAQEYSDQLGHVNSGVERFDADSDVLAHKVQVIESKHMTYTNKYLTQWASMTIKVGESELERFKELRNKANKFSATNDIKDFIIRTQRNYGRKPKPERFAYDLPYTLQEIKQGQFEKTESIFDATLDQVMKIQREADNPAVSSLEVPAIVLVLISAIQSLGGLTTEGIFRISAAKKDIDRLKNQINGGNYKVKEKSPHVAAGLLKLWIRHLPEPLVPSNLYETALQMGKKPEISPKDIKSFAARIPGLNRKIIGHIANLAQEVTKLKDINRMDMNNIAIVFAPGLLQDPGDDPSIMLANSKYEIKFTVSLFKHFPFEDGHKH